MASKSMSKSGPASKTAIVGYLLYGHDNRGTFFQYEPPPGVICPKCKSVLDGAFRPPYLPIKTGMDISSTDDNVMVASERFVEVCREHGLPGISFFQFEGKNKPYYFAVSDRVVPFDAKRRGTRFENKCRVCGNFESVVGVTPAYAKVKEPLSRGFYRTDLEFGSNQGKRPALVIDNQTAILFKSLGIAGMDLHPMEGVGDAI